MPELRPLVLGVPFMGLCAERKNALLGPRFFLVAPRTAKGCIIAARSEGRLERHGFHRMGVIGAMLERIDVLPAGLLVGIADQLHAKRLHHRVAEGDHVAEFPLGIDMQQRERRLGRIEGLHGEMKHHRRILADRVQHHRIAALRRNLADDVDALGLKALQMRGLLGHFGS